MKDLETKEDVALMVESFYGKVLENETLAPFFANLDFVKHMPKMIHFWTFVLLNEPGYTTNVTEKHFHMPLKKEHFDTWLEIFNANLDEKFKGKLAEMAKQRAVTIAWTINNKMEQRDKN